MVDSIAHIDNNRILKHVLFWFIWISSFTILQSFGFGIGDYVAWLVYYLITLPLFMVHTYVIAYFLVPKYFFNHRYLIFSIWIFALLNLTSVCELIISNELVWKLVKPENIQQGNYLNWSNILINGLGNEYIIIIFISVKVVRFWNSIIVEKAELENKKLATEIELLKYQSYPKFLLNVMDSLEQLAVKKSLQTSDMIIRLSNLISIMTSDRKSDKILLHKEIELIRCYIEIQRLSFPNDFKTNFLVTGELNRVRIPPFLFFQLVEEGFVVKNNSTENVDLRILMKSEPNYLLFSITLLNSEGFNRQFNPAVLENCHKYLNYFYAETHKVMSDFQINFEEVTIEIYF